MKNSVIRYFSLQLHLSCWLLLLSLTSPAVAADLTELGPGVWRVAGENASISPANLGAVVNTGIIATGEGVIIIDPGPTLVQGQVIAALVKTLTAEPIRWIIDTHAHPENVLANSAFPNATIIASTAAAKLMADRCTTCLQRLTDQLGEVNTRGTQVRLPTRLVQNGEVMTLGERELQFVVFPRAHTRGDLAVLLTQSAILFAGGLVNDARMPDLREATLSSWIAAVDALKRLSLRSVVPGHGPATDVAVLRRFGAYLTDLRTACDRDIALRGDAASSGTRLTLAQYDRWVDYALQHPLNVVHAYREREDAQLMGEESSGSPDGISD